MSRLRGELKNVSGKGPSDRMDGAGVDGEPIHPHEAAGPKSMYCARGAGVGRRARVPKLVSMPGFGHFVFFFLKQQLHWRNLSTEMDWL
jgi:hypothetical protein